jgi:transposase-like protein
MTNDSQPPPKRRRRKISDADKARILAEYEAASSLERAALMRREGIYASLLGSWRKQLNKGTKTPKRGRPKGGPDTAEIAKLKKENSRLTRRAEKAESLVDTLGKVQELLRMAAGKSETD